MEEFEGYKVPEPLSKEKLDSYVRDFNLGSYACHGYRENRFQCNKQHCEECLFSLSYPDDVRKRCCARWLEYKGYKITRKGIRDNMNNTIYISNFNSKFDIVYYIVKGWLTDVHTRFNTTSQYIYDYNQPYSIGIHVDVERCAEEHDVDWLHQRFDELFTALRQINGVFKAYGKIVWEHAGQTHVIVGSGTTLEFRKKDVREMTVDEISKALGYTVKVIGDQK